MMERMKAALSVLEKECNLEKLLALMAFLMESRMAVVWGV